MKIKMNQKEWKEFQGYIQSLANHKEYVDNLVKLTFFITKNTKVRGRIKK